VERYLDSRAVLFLTFHKLYMFVVWLCHWSCTNKLLVTYLVCVIFSSAIENWCITFLLAHVKSDAVPMY
jgi:hypothetical protein